MNDNSKCFGVNHFIRTFIPSGPAGHSEKARIKIGGCEPVVQFKYTVVSAQPVPNPLWLKARAVTSIFASGERDSPDQIVFDPLRRQPNSGSTENARSTTTTARRSLRRNLYPLLMHLPHDVGEGGNGCCAEHAVPLTCELYPFMILATLAAGSDP